MSIETMWPQAGSLDSGHERWLLMQCALLEACWGRLHFVTSKSRWKVWELLGNATAVVQTTA